MTMAKIMDLILPIVSVLKYWANIWALLAVQVLLSVRWSSPFWSLHLSGAALSAGPAAEIAAGIVEVASAKWHKFGSWLRVMHMYC